MNNRQIFTLILVAVAALVAGYFIGESRGGIKSESQITLRNQNDSLNYFLGLSSGYGLAEAPFEADAELISAGLNQVLNDTSAYDFMTTQTIMEQLSMRVQAQEAQAAEAAAADNMAEGIAFLEENGRKEGVITTESGLQYEVLTEGTGPKPSDTSRVSVFYEGTLVDGTVFDGNFETRDTLSFPLNNMITGWTEGLQLMSVGSTYMFYLPSNLGYGAREQGPIPANSVLIFRVELLDFE